MLGWLVTAGAAFADATDSGWIAQIGGQGADLVFDMTETSDGRVCATGTFWVRAAFSEGSDPPGSDPSSIREGSHPSPDPEGSDPSSDPLGSDPSSDREGSDSSSDPEGSDPSSTRVLEADDVQDIYVACYADDGSLAWATQFGAGRGDEPRAIASMPNGDVVLTGYFADAFGAGNKASLTADAQADVFLTRLDTRGDEVWARRFGGKLADNGNALAIADDGGILLAGSFQDVMLYPRAGKLKKLISAGSRDAFVFRLAADGEVEWAARFGGTGSVEASAVAAGPNGEVYVAGRFRGEASATADGPAMTALAHDDAFLLAFSPQGELLWSRQVAGEHQERVGGLAVDSRGRIFLAGTFQNELRLPDESTLESTGSTDVYVARFAPDGDLERAVSFGGAGIEQVYGLSTTSEDTLLLTGHFQGESDVAPGPREETLRAAGEANTNGFVVELDGDGAYRSALNLGGDGVEIGFGARMRNKDEIAVAGVFSDRLDVGGGQAESLRARGKTDVFVTRLNHPPEQPEVNAVNGDIPH